jgi:hypothetical protein
LRELELRFPGAEKNELRLQVEEEHNDAKKDLEQKLSDAKRDHAKTGINTRIWTIMDFVFVYV